MTHPAADLLRAIADGKQMEYLPISSTDWEKCTGNDALALISYGESYRVRIAREMVTRTVTYPAPLREKPGTYEIYFYPDFIDGVSAAEWEDDLVDNNIFSAGMAFATSEDAEAAHKALFGGGQ